MKLTILLASLLFAATSAKGVYVEGATTDSSVVEAVVAAAKLGVNEAPAANHRQTMALSMGPSMAPSMAPRRGLAPTGEDDYGSHGPDPTTAPPCKGVFCSWCKKVSGWFTMTSGWFFVYSGKHEKFWCRHFD